MQDGVIAMTQGQRRTYQLAMEVIRQKLTIRELSLLIDKSYRQSKRIVAKIRQKDALGALHGNQGKIPYNKTSLLLEADLISLLKTKYYDFNLTHFQEMALEKEGIRAGKNVIHRLAKSNGLVKRPKRRPRKIHKPRIRLPQEGMLVQFDGSEHNWFSNLICDLIVGIDDASSKIVGAEFFPGETSVHCLKVMRDITVNYGVPDGYYLDEAGYFGKKDRDQVHTQIGRALEAVGCKVIIAGSAQAKGRVERLFNTLQDRLIAELRLYEIKTIPQANIFLKEVFIPNFNKKFGIVPRSLISRYRPVDTEKNLELIFCRKEPRKVSSAQSFCWGGSTYVIENQNQDYRFRTININTHLDGSISFDILGKPIQTKLYKPQRKNDYYPNAAA
jgi:hypothetical protein